MLTYDIIATDHFRRLDSFLRNHLPAAPRSYLKKLMKSGHVSVNGLAAAPDILLTTGDRVALKESARTSEFLVEERPELDILYEDDRILVINKPAGLSMHRTAEFEEVNLVDVAGGHLSTEQDTVVVRPINRLDKGTSGAVILGLSSRSAGLYGRQVKDKGLSKVYLAAVAGKTDDTGEIDFPLDGKDSVTRFETIRRGRDVSFLAVYPITGRTHQIRRHLEGIGHSVIGDRRYGGGDLPESAGHLLHSFRTSFEEPDEGRDVTVHAPLPTDFLAFLRTRLGEELTDILAAVSHVVG